MSSIPVSIESLQGLLSAWFAPWGKALGLQVESFGNGEIDIAGAADGCRVCCASTIYALL